MKNGQYTYVERAPAQLSAEWHQLRREKVTASLAAACLGESPWTSPQAAYRQIVGEEKHISNWYMDHGREFEPVAVAAYEVETGRMCRKAGFCQRSDLFWLGASPDRFVDPDGLLEVKCSKKSVESPWTNWEIQCQVQMICTGRQWCDLCHYVGGSIKVWRFSPQDHEELIERLRWFAGTFVGPRRQPKRGEVQKWAKGK